MTRRSFLYALSVGAGLLAALWLIGLVLFVARVESYTEPQITADIPATDAIVVLTGGSERLDTGLTLLRAGKGKKLLISGVHPNVGAASVLAHSTLSPEMRACCVILGHAADNTLGNAEETRAFMQAEGFRSLRLVTSHYHMPRSLVFFRALMPDIEIVAHPVAPDIVDLRGWWRSFGTGSLLVGEYNKFLYAWLRASLGIV